MSPSKVIAFSLGLLILISSITIFIGIKNPILILNENQIFYLFSTSAQVLAGVFGLTLTGFIFFRNELSRAEFEDDTLVQAVENLKSRYFKILMFVTFLSISTLLISNLAISAESVKGQSYITIIMNLGQSLFVINLLVIAYFIFDVVSPKRIEKESKVIQQKVDPSPVDEDRGDLEDFLANFNKLEYILQKYGQVYQSDFENKYEKTKRRLSNVRLAEFILRAEKIDKNLFEEVKSLVTLRNSIIHGADPVVSKKVVELSKEILQKLATSLGVQVN